MPTLIVHLTDIHIKESKDPVLGRVDAIASAIASGFRPVPTSCIVVVSGDIAQSGKASEYDLAREFFNSLTSELTRYFHFTPKVFTAPGNHDCDMPEDPSAREDMAENIRKKGCTPSRESQLLEPQRNFLRFSADINPNQTHTNAWQSIFVDAASGINFIGLNSAMLSSLSGDQSKLYIPPEKLIAPPKEGLCVYVMHHPLNWLEANNANEVIQVIRKRCGLLMTGHEHRDDSVKTQVVFETASYETYAGDVLQDRKNRFTSAFRTLLLSQDNETIQSTRFTWSGNKYERDTTRSDDQARPLTKPKSTSTFLSFTRPHLAWINEPGASFTHHKKPQIDLSDIFVWPSLRLNVPDGSQTLLLDSTELQADEFLGKLEEQTISLIVGDEQSGKTTLAKRWLLELRRYGKYPLFVSYKTLTTTKTTIDERTIGKFVLDQYGASSVEDFSQLDSKERVLIIDDFELLKANSTAKSKLFSELTGHFSKIIVFVAITPGLEIAVESLAPVSTLVQSHIYELLPMSFKARSDLIHKWISIGEDERESSELEANTIRLARIVDDTLGRNLIPSVPLFILIILQQAEAERDLETVIKNGSHGFLYQSLITQSLSKRVRFCSIDTSTNYLTKLAGKLYSSSEESISANDLARFHVEHVTLYALDLTYEKVKSNFLASEVWCEKLDRISFKYPYMLFYFTANFLRFSPAAERRAAVDSLISTIHTERSANILLFLAHLSLDDEVISKLLSRADACFNRFPEYDLFKSHNLLEKVGANSVRQVYIETFSRGDGLTQLERSGEVTSMSEPSRPIEELWNDNDLLLSVNTSFKTLQVLGQVLRNHSGSLTAPVKTEIMEVCVKLGLRSLSGVFDVIERNSKLLVEQRLEAQANRQKKYVRSADNLRGDAEDFLRTNVLNIAVSILVKIAGAIGSEELSPTLQNVLASNLLSSRHLVDLAVRLEHFSKFPELEVVSFRDRKLGNDEILPAAIIRRFIVRRFYLFPDRRELKSKICDLFRIGRKTFQAREQSRAIYRGR